MIYSQEKAFKENVSLYEECADLNDNVKIKRNDIIGREGHYCSFSSLIKNASLPTVLTDTKMLAYNAEYIDNAFEGVLHISGDKVAFRSRYVRERFMDFCKKIKEMNPVLYTITDTFSIFEYGCFKKIVSFKSVCDMYGRIKILISVLTFETERALNPVILQDLFGFTPAESRLATLLVNGKSVLECAEALGVRISTVREQLSNLFAKTQTSRQPELVSMLSRLDLLG